MANEKYFFNTDEKTKQLIIDCLSEMAALGVPVSKSVYFRQGNGIKLWGCCYLGKHTKKYSAYDYVVSINKNLVAKKDIKETIIHELLHTIDITCGHKGEWKKWVEYINKNTNYNVVVKAPYNADFIVDENVGFAKFNEQQQIEYIDFLIKQTVLDENEIKKIFPFFTKNTSDYLLTSIFLYHTEYFLNYKKRGLIELFFSNASQKAKNKIVQLYVNGQNKNMQQITYNEFCSFSGLFALTKNYLVLTDFWQKTKGF